MARRARRVLEDNFKEAPLLDHLEELRWRIIWSVGAWIVGTGIAFNFLPQILAFLRRPLDLYTSIRGQKVEIISLDVTEQLTTSFLMAAFAGLIVAMPVILTQVWLFVAPGLTRKERGYAVPFIAGSLFAFLLGNAFAYFVALPFALQFLLTFLPGVTAQLTIGNYVNSVITPMMLMGALFQLPVLMFLLSKIGIISSKFYATQRRIAVFAIVVLAAIVTPTSDPVNLAIASVPLILLYEIGIMLARLAERQNARAQQLALAGGGSSDEFTD
jgi:sec-independent protein translocase protein TatC